MKDVIIGNSPDSSYVYDELIAVSTPRRPWPGFWSSTASKQIGEGFFRILIGVNCGVLDMPPDDIPTQKLTFHWK